MPKSRNSKGQDVQIVGCATDSGKSWKINNPLLNWKTCSISSAANVKRSLF